MSKKSKKEQRKTKHQWHMVGRVFRLSPKHVQMAKLLGANPRTTFDRWRDRAKERGISLATYVERRYEASYGNTDPMKCTPGQKNRKQKRLAAEGLTKLSLTIPTALQKRLAGKAERQGLTVKNVIQAALEAYCPPDAAPSEEPASDEAVEVPAFQAA